MTSLTKATENIDVLILCGGKGTRLQSVVSDRPKSMADVEDRPFLDILIEYITLFGFRRIILCVGYMKDMIKNHYMAKDNHAQILYSEEDVPLGTGGAVKNARTLVHGDRFIVVNGDTFCSLDYRSMVAFHDEKNALVTVSLVAQERRGDVVVFACVIKPGFDHVGSPECANPGMEHLEVVPGAEDEPPWSLDA